MADQLEASGDTSVTAQGTRVVLGKTWNGNESGTLWEAEWYVQDGRFYRQPFASGLFVGPLEFRDEEIFWRAFDTESHLFHGRRTPPTSGAVGAST